MTRISAQAVFRQQIRVTGAAWLLLCTLLSVMMPVNAEYEIRAFKLDDVAAQFNVRYALDERVNNEDFYRSNAWWEEFAVRTRSYVYHPALLNMNISGGLAFQQDTVEAVGAKNSEKEVLVNYDARFNFLARKSFPFSLYVRRQYPEMRTNLLGRYLTQADSYGATGRFKSGSKPMTLHWLVDHYDAAGSGFGSTVDESVDRANLRTNIVYGGRHNIGIALNWNDRISRSGSAGLPIRESLSEAFSASVSGTNTFGDRRQVSLTQSATVLNQDTTTENKIEFDRLSYIGNLGWEHTEKLRSNASYKFRDEDRDSRSSRAQDLTFGATYNPTGALGFSANTALTHKEDEGFELDSGQVRLTGNYRVPLTFGQLVLAGGGNFGRTDQKSATGTVQVFDEEYVLEGVTPVPLQAEFVLTDTVVVTNVPQTQVFVEGLDYRLVTIGSTTSIERIAAGNILDGQGVLVSYEYQTGGTAQYERRGQFLSGTLSLNRFASAYVRWNNTSSETLSGDLTVPLNDMTRLEAGAQLDIPLKLGWSIGGSLQHYVQDEDISPSDGLTYQVFANTGNYWGASAQFSVEMSTVDNEFSTEDVNLLRYSVDIVWRPRGSTQLSYNFYSSEDDGGSIVRENSRHRLQLDWRYRRVAFALRATRRETTQGASVRDDTNITAELRRLF